MLAVAALWSRGKRFISLSYIVRNQFRLLETLFQNNMRVWWFTPII